LTLGELEWQSEGAKNMNGKELIEALHSGKRIYGTLIISTSPKWVEVMRDLDIDVVFIDTEHIPMDWDKLGWMCHTFRGLGMAPIVRIPRPDPFEACRVLDMGAVGVVAAYMETAELKGLGAFKAMSNTRLRMPLPRLSTLLPLTLPIWWWVLSWSRLSSSIPAWASIWLMP